MRTINKINLLLLSIVFLTFGILSCSDNSTSVDSSEAVINGRVADENSAAKTVSANNTGNTEGVVITAARVTSVGSFETIDGVQTETNASGEFSLSVDVEQASHIAIMAQKESETRMGFLTTNVENGSSHILKPINAESTAETMVYARIVASGSTDIVSKADIQATVNSDIAAEVQSSSAVAAQIAAAATNSAETRAEFFAENVQGNAETVLNETLILMTEAQVELESNLHSATSVEQRESTIALFNDMILEAYVSSGLSLSSAAKSFEMQGRVFVNSLSSVSDSVENSIRANTSAMAALAIDKAVQAETSANGMSETTVQAVIEAGVHLRDNIATSGGAEADIKSAFVNYRQEIRAAYEADSSAEASLYLTLDAEINGLTGAKSIFQTNISGVINSTSVVNVYSSFFNDIMIVVESNTEDMNGINAEAIAELLILVNLAS